MSISLHRTGTPLTSTISIDFGAIFILAPALQDDHCICLIEFSNPSWNVRFPRYGESLEIFELQSFPHLRLPIMTPSVDNLLFSDIVLSSTCFSLFRCLGASVSWIIYEIWRRGLCRALDLPSIRRRLWLISEDRGLCVRVSAASLSFSILGQLRLRDPSSSLWGSFCSTTFPLPFPFSFL